MLRIHDIKMGKIKDILAYIQLYTDCTDHTLKRIEYLLEDFVEVREVVKIVEKKEFVFVTEKGGKSISKWAELWLSKNDVTYEEVSSKTRTARTIELRNKFCIDAYIGGFGYSKIGKYLGFDHSTIVHSIKKHKAHKL